MTSILYSATTLGFVGDGVTDNAPLWATLIPAGLPGSLAPGKIQWDGERYLFKSRPAPTHTPFTHEGMGPGITQWIRGYTPANQNELFVTFGGYMHLRGLDLAAGDGTSGGIAMGCTLAVSPVWYGDGCTIRDVRVLYDCYGAMSGLWKMALGCDGSHSPSYALAPGLRDWAIENLEIWACSNPSSECWVWLNGMHQFRWTGGYLSGGGNGDANPQMIVNGSPDPVGNMCQSLNVHLEPDSGGTLNISNADCFTVLGGWAHGGTISSSCTFGKVMGATGDGSSWSNSSATTAVY